MRIASVQAARRTALMASRQVAWSGCESANVSQRMSTWCEVSQGTKSKRQVAAHEHVVYFTAAGPCEQAFVQA